MPIVKQIRLAATCLVAIVALAASPVGALAETVTTLPDVASADDIAQIQPADLQIATLGTINIANGPLIYSYCSPANLPFAPVFSPGCLLNGSNLQLAPLDYIDAPPEDYSRCITQACYVSFAMTYTPPTIISPPQAPSLIVTPASLMGVDGLIIGNLSGDLTGSAVPEPSSLLLLASAVAALLGYVVRKRK
jgi:hypothetical protein